MSSSFFERLNKAVATLEVLNSNATLGPNVVSSKRKSVLFEKERNACIEIRNVLTNWNLSSLQRLDLSRALGQLFCCLDHADSSIRILADQSLEAIFRKFQIKFQSQRVIAVLLTELSKKCSSRSLCAALNKLALTIHLAKSHRAGVYGLHFMNSICVALKRPEEAVQTSIEKSFATIFAHVGPFVGPYVEKAEELFQCALENLDLSGAPNRAGCVVIAELSRHVPSILHKSFYKLSGIIFDADDDEYRACLSGTLNTFRLMWDTVIENVVEISLFTLHKLLCKILCCLYSNCNEVLIAALELLDVIVLTSPYGVLDFNPFDAQNHKCQSAANSPYRHMTSIRSSGSPPDASETRRRVDACSSKPQNVSSFDSNDVDLLTIEELDNSTRDDVWNESLSDVRSTAGESIISEFGGRTVSQPTTANDSFAADVDFVDPLLNCDNYLNADDELTTSPTDTSSLNTGGGELPVFDQAGSATLTSQAADTTSLHIVEYLPDDFCNQEVNFSVYSSLLVARRFLLSGLNGGSLRDDRDVRISHKILAIKFLSATVRRHQKVFSHQVYAYDCQQYLSDVYGFVNHDDDHLVIATLNLFMNVEKAGMMAGAKGPQSSKILSFLSRTLQNRSPIHMKGAFQMFTSCAQMLGADEPLLAAACELAVATVDCDYFLVKIARAEMLAAVQWAHTSAYARDHLQRRCLVALLRQLFDADARVVRAVCDALPQVVYNAELSRGERTEMFATSVPDWFASSGLQRIPMILGINMEQYSFRCDSSTSAVFVELNLSEVLRELHQLAQERFVHPSTQTSFLLGLVELSKHFPPSTFADAWLLPPSAHGSSPSGTRTSPEQRRSAQSWLVLLLEMANCQCSTIVELTSLTQLMSALFAGIVENALRGQKSAAASQQLRSFNSLGDSVNWPIDHQLFEGILIFYLRIFNLYYTLVAEEKTRSHYSVAAASATNFSIFARSNSGGLPAADKLSDLAAKVTSAGSSSSAASHSSTRDAARLSNLSYLVGTGIRALRPTSYLQSTTLRGLESTLRGAYKSFIETMKPEGHRRFVEPLTAAMDAFCVLLEVIDFQLAKSFLDEFLLYLRTLFDISVQHSANVTHQFLKSIFNRNAKNFAVQLLQTMRVKDAVQSNDFLEAYLMRSINEFTVFAAFVLRPEYMEPFLIRDGGWLCYNTLQQPSSGLKSNTNLLEIADSLRHFEPFITRLIQIYSLINTATVRIAILEVLCTLLLNDVSYEMIDQKKRFYGRVTAQIRQLFAEDAPLLGAMFTFLVILSRVAYITFAEVETLLLETFGRVVESNALHVLDAAHVVLLESCRLSTLSGGGGKPEAERSGAGGVSRKVQCHVKEFLCREFDFLFDHSPKAVTHLWVLLLNAARASRDEAWWLELTLDFFTLFEKFIGSPRRRLMSAQSVGGKGRDCSNVAHSGWWPSGADDPNNLYGMCVLLSLCAPAAFRPIDQFYGCIERLLAQIHRQRVRTESALVRTQRYNKWRPRRRAVIKSATVIARVCSNVHDGGREPFVERRTHANRDDERRQGSPQPSKGWSSANAVLAASDSVLPLIFVLVCQLDDQVVLLRLNSINNDVCAVSSVEVLGSGLSRLLYALTDALHSTDSLWAECGWGDGVENALVFFLQMFIHVVRASTHFQEEGAGGEGENFLEQQMLLAQNIDKSTAVVDALRRNLLSKFGGSGAGADEQDEDGDESPLCSLKCTGRGASRRLARVCHCFPKAHAYWFALLLMLDVRCEDDEDETFYFSRHYPSHTKALITVLLMQKIGDVDAAPTMVERFGALYAHAGEEWCARLLKWSCVIAARTHRPAGAKSSKTIFGRLPVKALENIVTTLEHFFVVHNVKQLLPAFCDCLRHLLSHVADGRSLLFCATDADRQFVDAFLRVSTERQAGGKRASAAADDDDDNNNDVGSMPRRSAERAQLLLVRNRLFRKHFQEAEKSLVDRATDKEEEEEEEEKDEEEEEERTSAESVDCRSGDDVAFYCRLARTGGVDAFHAVSAALCGLGPSELLRVVSYLPRHSIDRFFGALFQWILYRARCAVYDAHVSADDCAAIPANPPSSTGLSPDAMNGEDDNNEAVADIEGPDSPAVSSFGEESASTADRPSPAHGGRRLATGGGGDHAAQRILGAVFALIRGRGVSCVRDASVTVCALANMADLPSDLLDVERLFDGGISNGDGLDEGGGDGCADEIVDRLLNDLIAFLMSTRLSKSTLPNDYFRALRLFFGFRSVRRRFADDDCRLVESLAPFLLLLHDEAVERWIPRWKRFTTAKAHWRVEVEAADGRATALRDDLLQLFSTVQRVVHAFRRGLVTADGRDVEAAFKAILRLPLLSRMAVVPESALRLDWCLTVHARANRITVPLINIHMLSEHSAVLQDFVWRLLWLGWTSRTQFEDCWMSLFGVLLSTPIAADELHVAAINQIQASSVAVEALTNLVLLTLLYPESGNTVSGRFLVKHRCRRDDYLFLDTPNGWLAAAAKCRLEGDACLGGGGGGELNPSGVFTRNLELDEPVATDGGGGVYGFGQTSLYQTSVMAGLIELDGCGEGGRGPVGHRSRVNSPLKQSTSRYLIERSAELDTTSSLKALFDNFFHWFASAGGVHHLPISLLTATLKSAALLSDLIDDVTFYYAIFGQLKALLASRHLDEHPSRAYAVYMMLKCAAVVDWKDLCAECGFSSEAELARYLESVVDASLRPAGSAADSSSPLLLPRRQSLMGGSGDSTGAAATASRAHSHQHWSATLGHAALHGALYLLQSSVADALPTMWTTLTDFVMGELSRLRHAADIATDCSPETVDYHRMVWTAAFRLMEAPLPAPVPTSHRTNFMKMMCQLFVDPRLPTWQKRLLTRGMESLVVHSCQYSVTFRQLALECFDTIQLRPSHLPFTISLYATCVFREFNEGGETAYAMNKCFNRDFQRLLNLLSFYASSSGVVRCAHVLVPVLADLICVAWSKEAILSSVWELLAPLAAATTVAAASGRRAGADDAAGNNSSSDTSSSSAAVEFVDPLGAAVLLPKLDALTMSGAAGVADEEHVRRSGAFDTVRLTAFDRSLLFLLVAVVRRTAVVGGGGAGRRAAFELCWRFLLPKLAEIPCAAFAQLLAVLVMSGAAVTETCSWSDGFDDGIYALLLRDTDARRGSGTSPPCNDAEDEQRWHGFVGRLARRVFDAFLAASQKYNAAWTSQELLALLTSVNRRRPSAPHADEDDRDDATEPAMDRRRISLFPASGLMNDSI